MTNNSRIAKPLTTWTKTFELYIGNLFYTFTTLDTLRMISIEAYRASTGRFYNRLKHFTNNQNVVFIRSKNVHIILLFLLFSLLYLPILLHPFCALFMLVTIDVVYVNTVRFKYIDSSCHFIELNYRHNLNFLKLKQLLIDGDIESNPGPTQNDCKSSVGRPKKMKVFKGTAKKCDVTENKVNVASDLKVQNCFFLIQFIQSALTLLSHSQLLAQAL